MNRRAITLLVAALLLTAAPPGAGAQVLRAASLQRGLIASYPLDGDAFDQVTRARAAAVGTRPVEDRAGTRDGALWFDGARSAVNLGSSLHPSQFTLSAWVRPEATDRVQVILSKIRNLPGHYQKNLELRVEAGGRLFLHVPSGVAWEGVAGSRPLAPRRWTHVAATYDGARAQLYVDGQPDGAPLAVAYAQTQTDLWIGARPEGGGRDGRTASGPTFFFLGGIDDLRIWDRPLGPVEIELLAADRGAPPVAMPPPSAPPPPVPPPPPHHPRPTPLPRLPNPIAAYPLDGDARDAVGGADGLLLGTRPAEDRVGDPRGALGFAGRDQVDLGVRTEPERFTIALWIRPTRGDRQQVILSKRSTARDIRQKWLELGVDPFGRVSLVVPNADPFRYSVTSTPRLASGRWVHIAATYDGAVASLYFDGQPAGQAEVTPFEGSPGPVFLGARPEGRGRRGRGAGSFEGRMDDLRIFRGALTPGEVALLAAGPMAPPPPPGGGPGDDDDDAIEALIVRVGQMTVRYDSAIVRRDGDRVARIEEKILAELAEAARELRGERGAMEALRAAMQVFEQLRYQADPGSLSRKRAALRQLSEALWNEQARDMGGYDDDRDRGGARREGW